MSDQKYTVWGLSHMTFWFKCLKSMEQFIKSCAYMSIKVTEFTKCHYWSRNCLPFRCIQVHYRLWFLWGSCCSIFSFLCRSLLVFCPFCFWPFYCLSYSSYMFRIFKRFIEPNARMMLSQNKAKLRNKAQKIWTITGLNMIIKIYGWSSFKVKSQYEIAYFSF